jgi:hypothetical protein
MKLFLSLLAVAALVPCLPAQEKKQDAGKDAKVEVPFYGNEKCAYMKGKKVKMGQSVETTHGRVWVCCSDCVAEAQADGDKAYDKSYPKPKTHALKKCPVSGHDLGKDAVAMKWQGHEFKLCCKDCVDAFKKNPDAFLAKMENPKLNDCGNATCPVSGEPASGAVAIVGNDIVRLRNRKDADEFKKNVAEYLAKAKKEKGDGEKKDGEKPAPKEEKSDKPKKP